MAFPDMVPALRAQMSKLRGRLLPNQPLAEPIVKQPLSLSFDERGRLWVVQLSTTRRNARAWLPGFFGVLHTLVMQNSPQRHSSSL